MRQIILDTETTGLRVEDGHRLIEIACLEMINRKLTGNRFHTYINPDREVDAGAMAVHGITNHFLQDKPRFSEVVKELMDFIANSELIIHNAPFDVSFINCELQLTRQAWKPLSEYCTILDTLVMARQLHVGQRNSLDALCKRYKVDNSKRDLHGALLDTYLLAQVYLAMTGGQGSFFEEQNIHQASNEVGIEETVHHSLGAHKLVVLNADPDELLEHGNYLELLKKRGKCIWNI